jgi:protocatechuate 3,4-dioxygenase beta subunit
VTIAGQETKNIEFLVPGYGSILGKITDEKGAPVGDAAVYLGGRVYTLGAMHPTLLLRTSTDDKGKFRFDDVPAGRPLFLTARFQPPHLEVLSAEPKDPKLRRKVHASTYYPGSASFEGAQMFEIHSGQNLEGMDFVLPSAPSLCIQGSLQSGGDHRLKLSLVELPLTVPDPDERSTGPSISGGTLGPEGQYRICGLHPGEYQLTAVDPPAQTKETPDPPQSLSVTIVTITDRDIQDLVLVSKARAPIQGEVVLEAPDSDSSAPSTTALLSIYLMPTARPAWMGESKGLRAQATIPGQFLLPGVFTDEYKALIYGVPKGFYLKSAIFGTDDVLHGPLRGGTSLSSQLRITLANDGGIIQARVVDSDGNPVPDCTVLISPHSVTSVDELSVRLTIGRTDQNGAYSSDLLPNGKYNVFATTERIYSRPDSLAKVWRSLSSSHELDLPSKGGSQVTLTPVELN